MRTSKTVVSIASARRNREGSGRAKAKSPPYLVNLARIRRLSEEQLCPHYTFHANGPLRPYASEDEEKDSFAWDMLHLLQGEVYGALRVEVLVRSEDVQVTFLTEGDAKMGYSYRVWLPRSIFDAGDRT